MKIKKKEFEEVPTWKSYPEAIIEKVIYPFLPTVNNLKVSVYFCRRTQFSWLIGLDWDKYELILFNVIQNAVKYNQFMGNLVVILNCYPNAIQADHFVFETTVIDTGIGIPKDLQKSLFVPFKELNVKQDIDQVKNGSIGLGLACSKEITFQMKGDIRLAQSS